MVEQIQGGAVITGGHIQLFQMVAQLKALELEILGLKRRGRSVYAIIKEHYGLKGGKQKVRDQFAALVEETRERLG